MSFLKLLQAKKETLKNTTTVITYSDGRRFLQQGNKPEQQILEQPLTHGFVVDNKPDDTPALIVDRLYLGSQDCCHCAVLKKYQIAKVLSVGIPAPCIYDDVSYKFIQCLDLPDTNIKPMLNECLDFLHSCRQENVLVHCNAGVSRSPTIVIGYLLLKRNFNFDEAFSLVKCARPAIQPNVGFMKQLKLLTNYNMQ